MDFFVKLKNARLIALFISILVNIALVVLCLFFIYQNYNYTCPVCEEKIIDIVKEEQKEEIIEENLTFYVEVKGAVKNPGVFKVNKDNIINDVIALAGGFNKNAYTKNINLSKHLSKELVIYVYTNSEYAKFLSNEEKKEEVKEVICDCVTYDISKCLEIPASEIISNDEIINNSNDLVTKKDENNLLNINMATKEELMSLPGIGEAKALDIISYRDTFGLFKTIEDIKNVSGIGNALYEKIKDYITI